MRVHVKYIGQMPEERVPIGKRQSSKGQFYWGEVEHYEEWYIKLSLRPPKEAEMQKLIDLANAGFPDKTGRFWASGGAFVLFLQWLIEAQGQYSREYMREFAKIPGFRWPRKIRLSFRRV